jgi:hypothetical protein
MPFHAGAPSQSPTQFTNEDQMHRIEVGLAAESRLVPLDPHAPAPMRMLSFLSTQPRRPS